MQYRADIDGLRAVAVLGVIAFHTGLGFLPGGYLGVDVFFVISGFLITRIVAREVESGTFSFADFYARRVRRILPALLFVIVATLPFALLYLLPNDLEGMAQSILATLFFVSNFWFYIETDYFSGAAELKPFIHTWSLAIEEQFYLFFPLLFLLASRFGRRTVIVLPAVLGMASLVAAEVAVRVDASAAFYFTFFRIWEFVAGILLALTRWEAPARLAPWSGLFGLALVLGSMVLFEADSPVPGLLRVVPVLGAVLLLADGHRGPVSRILSWRPMVAVGLVSYSTYLWHQPIFAFARLRLPGEPDAPTFAALTVLTLALGYLSWRFVEQPFRHRATVPTRRFAGIATALVAPLLLVAAYVDREAGLPSRLPPEYRAVLMGSDPYPPRILACSKIDEEPAPAGTAPRCVLNGNGSGPMVHLLGDSHAGALGEALVRRLASVDGQVLLTFAGGCVPLDIDVVAHKPVRCARFRDRVAALLETDDPNVRTVVIAARWAHYFADYTLKDEHGNVGDKVPLASRSRSDATSVRRDAREQLETIIDGQIERGRRVVLVYPVPDQIDHVPRKILGLMARGEKAGRPVSQPTRMIEDHAAPAVSLLDAIADRPGLSRVRPADLLCDTFAAAACAAEADGLPLYWDDDHLNVRGAALVIDAMSEALPRQTSELQNR